jgi:hypothetical protein
MMNHLTFRTAHIAGLAASLALTSLLGCAANSADAGSADEQNVTSAKTLFTAKLYADANHLASPDCDVHTFLSVEKSGAIVTAKLENRVSGSCEIMNDPNPRAYVVTPSDDGCGTTVYAGSTGADRVTIEDNRGRTCEDYRPSVLTLDETRGGKTRHLNGTPVAGGGSTQAPQESRVLDVRLYADGHHTVSPSCDLFTRLVIGKEGSTLVGALENQISAESTCEIAVVPNARTYPLTSSADGCGSTIYEGKTNAGALRVQDHRGRICEDLRVDVVEVEETVDGKISRRYGAPDSK